MKSIAIIAPQFPVLSETFIRTEIDALQTCQREVTVFTFQQLATNLEFHYPVHTIGDIKQENSKHAIRSFKRFVAQLSATNVLRCKRFIDEQQSLPKRSLWLYSLKLAYQLAQANIQHVHAHFSQHTAAHGIAAAKLLGISASFVGHGHDVNETPFDIATKIKHADFVVAVCKEMQNKFNALYQGNIKYLHCGVKTALFKANSHSGLTEQYKGSISQASAPSLPIKLVFVGRLIEPKGVKYLLKSLSLLKNSTLTLDIIGNGELISELKQQTLQLELTQQVNFLGSKPHSWLVEHLPSYDCLVAPFCVARSGSVDTGPLVLKEAMAAGLPVITTDIGGCQEIVTLDTGYIVAQKNSQQLSQALNTFCQLLPQQRAVMGYEARQRVTQHFDSEQQARNLCRWIDESAQNSAAPKKVKIHIQETNSQSR
ncbi:glycosyltransferase family 4 protein [Photobacterium jeanii]|uniref:glycosyltransferase family 4 protein n=1 Tax=Photobacterium jeanii TaxID=858640 RepID=UPI0009FFB206|nr:glycosyltransferase family 4 protein [Photobacterium jeanii]PST91260.1 colanic acid biosynthesis glycosyltransferase WcaL [Photobacterium jeanii]